MRHPHFFGYGSLVNRQTHSYQDARPAEVRGWRRCWRHTVLRDVAFLTVVEAPDARIDGLIAAVPAGDWAALDLREAAYDRLALGPEDVTHDHPEPIGVQIYRTRASHDAAPTVLHPVLLSYIDTVVAGFRDVFGDAGAQRFFATTDGWDAPVLDDRKAPVYRRAIPPTSETRKLVDAALDALSVHRFRR